MGTHSPLESRVEKNESSEIGESSEILDRKYTSRLEIRHTAACRGTDRRESDRRNLGTLPDDCNSIGELDEGVER